MKCLLNRATHIFYFTLLARTYWMCGVRALNRLRPIETISGKMCVLSIQFIRSIHSVFSPLLSVLCVQCSLEIVPNQNQQQSHLIWACEMKRKSKWWLTTHGTEQQSWQNECRQSMQMRLTAQKICLDVINFN